MGQQEGRGILPWIEKHGLEGFLVQQVPYLGPPVGMGLDAGGLKGILHHCELGKIGHVGRRGEGPGP